jgi:hypothetical protein
MGFIANFKAKRAAKKAQAIYELEQYEWEQNSYGALSMPPEILEYKNNPPAFAVIGKILYI